MSPGIALAKIMLVFPGFCGLLASPSRDHEKSLTSVEKRRDVDRKTLPSFKKSAV